MAFIPDKPLHSRYAFRNLTPKNYTAFAQQYSKAKKGGIGCVYVWASGAGVFGIIKDVSKGLIVDYGKRKLAMVCLCAATYVSAPAVAICTNFTKIVKVSKRLHGGAAFIFECAEDISNLMFLPFDMALFGQQIPVGSTNRFNLFQNNTDFLDIL